MLPFSCRLAYIPETLRVREAVKKRRPSIDYDKCRGSVVFCGALREGGESGIFFFACKVVAFALKGKGQISAAPAAAGKRSSFFVSS